MSQTTTRPWEAKRTEETRSVERFLEAAGLQQVDAYRYNSASIRVRVIDSPFEGLSDEKRDAMVEPFLDQLPPATQEDTYFLLTLAPSEHPEAASKMPKREQAKIFRKLMINTEFEGPSPSML